MSNDFVTIAMYHYIRPLKETKYPDLKGLDLCKFKRQLDYINKNFNVISASDLAASKNNKKILPKNPILLSFDDGYIDHYVYAMPELLKRGMTGIFFPPTEAIKEKKILDVNKIHFILAASKNKDYIKELINTHIGDNQSELKNITEYEELYLKKNRYDCKTVNYIKRMLQVGLPQKLRANVIDKLFDKIVSKNQKAFSEELYLSTSNLKEMLKNGMEIGSHGHSHPWLNSLSKEDQFEDIKTSISFLENEGISMKDFLFCYPYGAYNNDTIEVLKSLGCLAAFTVQPKKFILKDTNLLELPRLDTNDLPN